MNIILVDADRLDADGCFELRGERADHVRHVLKARPGQELRAGVARGSLGVATVEEIGEQSCRLRFTPTGPPASEPMVDLVIALPRPRGLGRVIEYAASMGVARIDIINAWRVDKSYLDSPRLASSSLASAAALGCEQGGHTWVPEIAVHRRFMSFCEQLPEHDERARLVAHPAATSMFFELEGVIERRVLLAVGPEGGWIRRELDTLVDRSFALLRLSERILRSEVAVVASLAQLELARQRCARDLT